MRCFISAGHGPRADGRYDPGVVVDGVEEHVIAEWVAREMAHALAEVEPHVVPRGELTEKIAYVNRWSRPGDVAVEIHLNSGPAEARGCEVFYCSQRGRHLASVLHAEIVKLGRAPRGPKSDTESALKRLAWCRDTKPWSVLVEVAFLSNQGEREWLEAGGAQEAGQALARGIESWP